MRILIFGDSIGVPQLLRFLPEENIVAIVGATIRSQSNDELAELSFCRNIKFLIQPRSNSEDYESFVASVRSLKPDLVFVNSYSMFIREEVLSASRLGGINLHAGLLPRNRGCNPTQWAIINNEFITGVTMHEMDSSIDTGPIIDQRKIPILFDDTWVDIRAREAQATNDLLESNLPEILTGSWRATPQQNKNASTGRRRTPQDSEFFWSEKIIDIHNKIRALVPPLPPAFYFQKDQKIEIAKYLTPWELVIKKFDPSIGGGQLQSERLKLRPLKKSDSDLLYEWVKDRDLLIYNASYYPVSESDHQLRIEKMITKRSDLVIFVIELLDKQKVIGSCQLFNINWVHRNAELQILIGDRLHQSKGYGIEAVELLCDFGFEDLNLHRIYLQVFADNARAIEAYKKCGFSHEGTQQEAVFVDGQWKDVLNMGKLAGNG